ncbi:MAG: hypothetical protein ACI84C_001385 [Flavobacteriales bacterium]|jgi:hypothetical protein
MRILFISLFTLLCGFSMHKYYISNTKIVQNELAGSFEITMKIFTDDFEKTLNKIPDERVILKSGQIDLEISYRIESYAREHFKISIDDRPITWRYVGAEVENDMSYIYFEFIQMADFKELKVENTMLFDEFEQQSNIIDIEYLGKRQKMILTRDEPVDSMLN